MTDENVISIASVLRGSSVDASKYLQDEDGNILNCENADRIEL